MRAPSSPKPAASQIIAAAVPSHKIYENQIVRIKQPGWREGKNRRFDGTTRQKIPAAQAWESIC
jgi:hypothetical protein